MIFKYGNECYYISHITWGCFFVFLVVGGGWLQAVGVVYPKHLICPVSPIAANLSYITLKAFLITQIKVEKKWSVMLVMYHF